MVTVKSFFQKAPITPQDQKHKKEKKPPMKKRLFLCQPYQICGDVVTTDNIDVPGSPYHRYGIGSKDDTNIPLTHLAFMMSSSETSKRNETDHKIAQPLLNTEINASYPKQTIHNSALHCDTILEEEEEDDDSVRLIDLR